MSKLTQWLNVSSAGGVVDLFPIMSIDGPLTFGVCSECFGMVITEHKHKHQQWHDRTDRVLYGDIDGNLNT